jgi:hypothetical protein
LAKAPMNPAKAKVNPAPEAPEAEVAAPSAKAAKAPKEKKIQTKTRGPYVVGAREEEMDIVQRETHSCGGGFEIEIEEVRGPTETTGPMDVLKTLCSECGAHVDFLFDISSFYGDGESGLEEKGPPTTRAAGSRSPALKRRLLR